MWAQITLRIKGKDKEKREQEDVVVFERRIADKLSKLDWKLCYQISLKDSFLLK